jgi:chromatin remodeling complex protein RSC6
MSSTAPAKTSTKGRKASSTTTAVAASPAVAAPVPVAAPVAAAPAVVEAAVTTTTSTENVNVVEQFNKLVENVSTLRSTLSTVFAEMKKLEKQIPKELKKAQKRRGRKAATVDGVEAPKRDSVFTKPTQISDALCTFLGVAKGTQVSRSEVTARVCAYAKEKGLMDKQNIKADASLRKLLALTEKDELKILNLQRYLKPHYIKPAAAATPATASK